MLRQFRRAAGDVDHGGFVSGYPILQTRCGIGGEHLGAPRGGVHVAMAAGLVALAAHVELERDECAALEGAIVLGQFCFKAIHAAQYKVWTPNGNAIIIRA